VKLATVAGYNRVEFSVCAEVRESERKILQMLLLMRCLAALRLVSGRFMHSICSVTDVNWKRSIGSIAVTGACHLRHCQQMRWRSQPVAAS